MDKPSIDWSNCVEYAALSDVGMRRINNQDAYAVELADSGEQWQDRGHFFVVADGMGAHAAGEQASKMATEAIQRSYFELTNLPPPLALRESIIEANTRIHAQGQASPEFHGMGTTCSTLLLLPQGALVAHVGDSRVYRLRKEKLEQFTFDHSLVWEMIESRDGCDDDPITLSVPKNVITRSLGPNPDIKVDLEGPFPILAGDTYLLCSDGLTGLVRDEEIGGILGCLSPKDSAQTLLDLAIVRGGNDNITAIVVRVTDNPSVSPDGNVAPHAPGQAAGPLAARTSLRRALWIVMCGCLVAAVVGFVAGKMWLAVISLIGGLIAGGLALACKPHTSQCGDADTFGGPYGKGPHRESQCHVDQKLVESLAEAFHTLLDLAHETQMPFDERLCEVGAERATSAAARHDFAAALADYATVIRYLTGVVRDLKEGDSGVHL